MRTVGAYEAKTHLPSLLKAVERGETVVITRRGVPIARLVPAAGNKREDVAAIIERMKRDRARRTPVSVEDILSARDEGRKG